MKNASLCNAVGREYVVMNENGISRQTSDVEKRIYEAKSAIRRIKPLSATPSSIVHNSIYIPVSERLCLFNDARELYEASHDK